MAILEDGAGLDDGDAGALEIEPVEAGQARNFLFLGVDERAPVEARRLRQLPAEPRSIFELVGEAARIDVELFRHAAADDAGAADAEFLRDHHLGTVTCRDARRAYPARARADDEEIDIKILHRTPIRVRIS